ncbi:MAG: hypothetical protein JST68_06905 [Bacteroidetes bacterium]|nr:hypothetical protein [Bacteroidota bacterium]
MQEFRITEEDFKKNRKKYLIFMVPLMIAIIAGVVIFNLYTSKDDDFNTIPFLLPVLFAIYGFSLYRGVKRQREYMTNYVIIISDEEIIRKMPKMPDLAIRFFEIKEIVKTKKGGFMVTGIDRADVIHIPRLMNKDGVLEQRLSMLAPITTGSPSTTYFWLRKMLPLFGTASMIISFVVQNSIISVFFGLVAVGLFIWAAYDLQTNKNVSSRVKWRVWRYVLIILFIILVTVAKLTIGWLPR